MLPLASGCPTSVPHAAAGRWAYGAALLGVMSSRTTCFASGSMVLNGWLALCYWHAAIVQMVCGFRPLFFKLCPGEPQWPGGIQWVRLDLFILLPPWLLDIQEAPTLLWVEHINIQRTFNYLVSGQGIVWLTAVNHTIVLLYVFWQVVLAPQTFWCIVCGPFHMGQWMILVSPCLVLSLQGMPSPSTGL